MYPSREKNLHENINNTSLVYCTKIAQKAKEPPYIPFLEVYTYDLIARYFDLSESRIKNAYISHRNYFEDDCTSLSGKDIAIYASDKKNLGKHYGYLCYFPNGVVAEVAYSANIVFNSRALLHFAVLLDKESEVASNITSILDSGKYKNKGYLARRKPWFFTDHESVHTVDMCPFIAQLKCDKHFADTQVEKQQSKKNENSKRKKCARISSSGKILQTFDSASEAAEYYGLNKSNVYNVLSGVIRTTHSNGTSYRFKYI